MTPEPRMTEAPEHCNECKKFPCVCDYQEEPDAFDPQSNRYRWPEDRR